METIRQYAAEKLREHDEIDDARRRHRDWLLAYAARVDLELTGSDASTRAAELTDEIDNFRTALAWSLAEPNGAGIDAAFEFAATLEWFWFERDFLGEGRWWLERILAADASRADGMAAESPAVGLSAAPRRDHRGASVVHGWHPRVAALNHLSNLAYHQQDRETQLTRLQAAMTLARQVEDTYGLGHAFAALGNLARAEGDYERSSALLQESLDLFRQAGSEYGVWRVLTNLGETRGMLGDFARATTLIEESQQRAYASGDPWRIAQGLRLLGLMAYGEGDLDRAATLLDEAVTRWRAMNATRGPQWALYKPRLGPAGAGRPRPGRQPGPRPASARAWLCQKAGDRRGVARASRGSPARQ